MDNFDLDELINMKKPLNNVVGGLTAVVAEPLDPDAGSEDYDDFDESDEEFINGKVEGTDGFVIPGGTGAGP